ncbi:MAG: 1,2-phenylacetyl-CoA epoxidase subunit A, partial [Pseudonocardiales bacterium]
EFKRVVGGDGPCNADRIAHRRAAQENGAWVREAAMAHALKAAKRPPLTPPASQIGRVSDAGGVKAGEELG